jgi:RNA polymerase primary sigma factor
MSTAERRDDLGPPIERAAGHPLLTAADETRLARRIRRGDRRARDRMIECNLRLVICMARPYRGRGMPLSDLVQAGTLGLIRAVDAFDPRRGLRFSTYAAWWIRRELLGALADGRVIRIPPAAVRRIAAIRDAESGIEHAERRQAAPEEVARRTGFRARTVVELRQAAHVTTSLDATARDGETALGDLVAGEGDAATALWRRIDRREGHEQVRRFLRALPARHREVVTRRFGLEGAPAQSHRDIAQGLGLGEERTRQIEREALHRLRSMATQRAA